MSSARLLLLGATLLACRHLGAAHICMWEPMQRGSTESLHISQPGDSQCYHRVAPCGGVTGVGPVITQLEAGSLYTVNFQQNLNHYYTKQPGQLILDYAVGSNPTEAEFTPLVATQGGAAWADFVRENEISQTNYSRQVLVPDIECDHCVVRARYATNNPDEVDHGSTVFYQCADVAITKSSRSAAAPAAAAAAAMLRGAAAPAVPVAASDPVQPCCSPDSFTAQFSYAHPKSMGTLYYDATHQFMRVDVVSGDGKAGTTDNGSFRMYSNYSSGIQWYFNAVSGKCLEYGLDQFDRFCYGAPGYSETPAGLGPCTPGGTGTDCRLFSNGEWTFAATADSSCLPAYLQGSELNQQTIAYENVKVGPIDPSTWQFPAACKPAGQGEARLLRAAAAAEEGGEVAFAARVAALLRP